MSSKELVIRNILSEVSIDPKDKMLVLNGEDVFFVSYDRVIDSVMMLPPIQQAKILKRIVRCKDEKVKLCNLFHDFAKPVTSVRL